MDKATFDERLADRTPWTLADIVRELSMMELLVAGHAERALHFEADTHNSFPAPLPGPGSRMRLAQLFKCAQGRRTGGPVWAAGDIRRWALRTARLDREFNVIVARPPSLRSPRTRETNPTRRTPRKD